MKIGLKIPTHDALLVQKHEIDLEYNGTEIVPFIIDQELESLNATYTLEVCGLKIPSMVGWDFSHMLDDVPSIIEFLTYAKVEFAIILPEVQDCPVIKFRKVNDNLIEIKIDKPESKVCYIDRLELHQMFFALKETIIKFMDSRLSIYSSHVLFIEYRRILEDK